MDFDEKNRRLRIIKIELHSLFKQRKGFLITADQYKAKVIPLVEERNKLLNEMHRETT
jgi:hypothetical protein